MRFLFILSVVAVSVLAVFGQNNKNRCSKLRAPQHGEVECTHGNKQGSRCVFKCGPGYRKTSGNKLTCACRKNKCAWRGKPFICGPKSPPPQPPAPVATEPVRAPVNTCPMPNFQRASFGVVETSPNGAFLRVTVKPEKTTKNGFTAALVFPKPFPKSATFSAGHVEIERAENDRILMVKSMDHVGDISMTNVYSFYIQITNIPGLNPSKLTALVGFYNGKIEDVSCILEQNVVRPLPTTTTKKTPTTTTKKAPVTTSRPPTVRPTPTTKTTTTTTVKPAPTPEGCEVLSNEGPKPGYIVLNTGWNEGSDFKFTARAQKFDDVQGNMDDWTIKMEFSQPIDDIEVFIADAEGPFMDGRVWILKPKSFNKKFQTTLQIAMVLRSSHITSAPDCIVTFCNNNNEPDPNVTLKPTAAPTTTKAPTPTQSPITTTKKSSVVTTTRKPQTTGRCSLTSPFSSLPTRSHQTDPTNYPASKYVKTTKYDYNEILHLSLLFYEAQRSGKLTSSNRIGFRGDSGLKDGCQVGLDLSKGYYDAGDNVKFGFPMAYTITTIAWSMIEFGEAYQEAGEYERGLEMIKWATDYFIAAHPTEYELYVQVADASADHSRWERPEDSQSMRRLYKIDQNNPGSDVAAETAAALAAASILFKTEDKTYSDTLLRHAKQLYDFANRYRGAYHNSVPGVETYYKSWSGYNDELLWSVAWLYKATGTKHFLDTLRERYNSYGAGNTPGEYSWDNKYPGVQILMADFTGENVYRDHVTRFMTHAMNLPTTPMGLTWKLKWGPNRYAANFAAIATFAAKLEPDLRNKGQYLQYARQQIHYLLGENERSASYVVGYGMNPPRKPHHRASSCPSWRALPVQTCGFDSLNKVTSNPHVLFGALVGGPDINGNYVDDRKDYIANEVATDYNAGFQSAVAGLLYFAMEG